MSEKPLFSIITTCKGRLDHLKQSLPRMAAQQDSEVIVVDFSCPENSAAYVATAYPSIKVARVENKDYFSNWEARNIGAAQAIGRWLVFVDADIILAEDCSVWLEANLEPNSIAKFPKANQLARHRSKETRLSPNSLQGFQVIERAVFEELGGYDIVLQGYGAGGDTDLTVRALLSGLRRSYLPEHLVSEVIGHSDDLRFRHSPITFAISYLTGLIYRESKKTMMRISGMSVPMQTRRELYDLAADVARNLLINKKKAVLNYPFHHRDLGMKHVLGYPRATIKQSITVEVDLEPD